MIHLNILLLYLIKLLLIFNFKCLHWLPDYSLQLVLLGLVFFFLLFFFNHLFDQVFLILIFLIHFFAPVIEFLFDVFDFLTCIDCKWLVKILQAYPWMIQYFLNSYSFLLVFAQHWFNERLAYVRNVGLFVVYVSKDNLVVELIPLLCLRFFL